MSIFEVRLRIQDPSDVIRIIQASTVGTQPQTAYLLPDGNYYNKASELLELSVSDESLQSWINLKGEDFATCQALRQILNSLGKRLGLAKSSSGSESLEYTSLKDLYDYYKGLLALCSEDKKANENNNATRWGSSKAPLIAGGEV